MNFIHSNRTQRGAYFLPPFIIREKELDANSTITLAIPVALNFVASGECSCLRRAGSGNTKAL